MSFREYRIILLLSILFAITGITYWENWSVTQWKTPLEVVIYPVNGEDVSDADVYAGTQAFMDTLTGSDFQEISSFIDRQSERYLLKKLNARLC